MDARLMEISDGFRLMHGPKKPPLTRSGSADFRETTMRKDKKAESGIAECEATRPNAWLSNHARHAAPS